MEQFNLEKWLQDKSQKVVTRNRKPVRIVCWDKLGDYPIIGCVKYSDDYEELESYNSDGFKYSSESEYHNDLFFADEEEELTGFEKAMQEYYFPEIDDFELKRFAKGILDMARKELERDSGPKCISTDIEQDIFDNMTNLQKCFVKMFKYADYHGMVNAIKQFSGLAEALIKKDLPKWKKATEHKSFEKLLAILKEDKVLLSSYLKEGDYYIDLEDLKTLPNEE